MPWCMSCELRVRVQLDRRKWRNFDRCTSSRGGSGIEPTTPDKSWPTPSGSQSCVRNGRYRRRGRSGQPESKDNYNQQFFSHWCQGLTQQRHCRKDTFLMCENLLQKAAKYNHWFFISPLIWTSSKFYRLLLVIIPFYGLVQSHQIKQRLVYYLYLL